MSSQVVEEGERRRGYLVWVALGLLLLVGFWLRAADLGVGSFQSDEYYHVHAGMSYAENGNYTLTEDIGKWSAGHAYERSWPYTWQVATMFRLFGVSETTARIPSLFWGMLLLLVVFFTSRDYVGSLAALLTTAVAVFDPLMVYFSRFTRMYGMLAVLFVVSAWCCYRGFEKVRFERDGVSGGFRDVVLRRIDWKWLVAGLALYLLSVPVHETSHVIPVAVGLFCLASYPRYLWARRATARSYLIFAGVCVGCAGAALLGLFVLAPAASLPLWLFTPERELLIGTPNYAYLRVPFLAFQVPVAGMLLAAVAVYGAVVRRGRWVAYLLCYLLPVLIGVSVFGWRINVVPRYLMFVLPFAWLLSSHGATLLLRPLRSWGGTWLGTGIFVVGVVSLFPRWNFPGLPPDVLFEWAEADKPAAKGLFKEVDFAYPAGAPSTYVDTRGVYEWLFRLPDEHRILLTEPKSYYIPEGRSVVPLVAVQPGPEQERNIAREVRKIEGEIEAHDRGVLVMRRLRDRWNLGYVHRYIESRGVFFKKLRDFESNGFDVYYWGRRPKPRDD